MGDQQSRLKVIEVTNVDFSLRQFLLPLMRAMRARGHEVIGGCADGPYLAVPRAEGFRIEALKLERSVSLAAHWQAFRGLLRLFRAERPDLVHAHMPISGFLARMAAWWAGVPRIAYTGHGFWFNFPGSWPRSVVGFAMEWLAARVTGTFLLLVKRRRAMPDGCTSIAGPLPSATAAIRHASSPTPPRASGSAPRLACRTSRWWCSRCHGWSGTRAIPSWRSPCVRFRMRCCGWRASG